MRIRLTRGDWMKLEYDGLPPLRISADWQDVPAAWLAVFHLPPVKAQMAQSAIITVDP